MGIFTSFVDRAKRLIDGKAEERAFKAGNLLRNHLLAELSNQKPRTGKKYKIPGTDIEYTASAPGEYPALATGRLRASLGPQAIQVERNSAGISVTLGEGVAAHGELLESGKDGQPGDGIRPWFSKGIDEVEPRMRAELKRKWF